MIKTSPVINIQLTHPTNTDRRIGHIDQTGKVQISPYAFDVGNKGELIIKEGFTEEEFEVFVLEVRKAFRMFKAAMSTV